MGQLSSPAPVMPILVAFSRDANALDWAARQASEHWGTLVRSSDVFEFSETDYYTPTMGQPLGLRIFAFERLVDASRLVEMKLATNTWEDAYQERSDADVQRAVNLDAGYLNEAKFVLASTKDHSHRIYLDRGIYAEITLSYRRTGWEAHRWTYPNYRRTDYQSFLTECRTEFRRALAAGDDA